MVLVLHLLRQEFTRQARTKDVFSFKSADLDFHHPLPYQGLLRSPTDVQCFFHDNCWSPLCLCPSQRKAKIPLWPRELDESRQVHNINFILDFFRIGFMRKLICTTGLHLSSSLTSVLPLLSRISITTLATQKVACSTQN